MDDGDWTNPKEIFEEINTLRADPKKYAEKILGYIDYFTGDILRIPGTKIGIQTTEGPQAYREAAAFLNTLPKLEQYKPSKALRRIAKGILEKAKNSETGDISAADVEKMIDENGSFDIKFTRSMDFGGMSAEQVVISCIVCDGDPARYQRASICGDDMKVTGVAFGKHSMYHTIAVISSSYSFTNTKDADDLDKFEDVKCPGR